MEVLIDGVTCSRICITPQKRKYCNTFLKNKNIEINFGICLLFSYYIVDIM